jgi:hypothetical protein
MNGEVQLVDHGHPARREHLDKDRKDTMNWRVPWALQMERHQIGKSLMLESGHRPCVCRIDGHAFDPQVDPVYLAIESLEHQGIIRIEPDNIWLREIDLLDQDICHDAASEALQQK